MDIQIQPEHVQKAGLTALGAILTGIWLFIKRTLKLERESLLVKTNQDIGQIMTRLWNGYAFRFNGSDIAITSWPRNGACLSYER